jgi:tetratricopeptide (TPR) repeat protein
MNRVNETLLWTIAAAALAVSGSALAQEPEAPPDPTAEPAAAPDPEQEERAEKIAEANDRIRGGDFGGAAEILADLIDDRTDDVSLLTQYGEVLLASGDAKGAVPILERAVRADPERLRLHFQIATAHTTLGEIDQALAAYAREIELNEDVEVRYLAHLNRSILYERQKSWAEAAAALEQALELKSEPDAYAQLTALYLRAGDLPGAIAALERGAEVGFRSARLYFNVGARLYNDHKYAEAERAFRSAVEIDPEMAEAERSLGATLSQLGRAEEAREHLARYLELRPDAPDADEVREHLASGS